MSDKRFVYRVTPETNSESVVGGKKYRFSILSAGLIRCEFDEDGVFEDRATQTVVNRRFEPAHYSVDDCGETLKIITDSVEITYKKNQPFSAEALSFKLLIKPYSVWNYGEDFEDLGGTARTLDAVNGELPLGRGVCSRDGFSIIDDSSTAALGDDGWVTLRNGSSTDVYFFGFGRNYLAAVKALYMLTGAPAMLPAYALGNWWSRYYKYTEESYLALLDKFKNENIPFSVAVVDMDWHTVDVPDSVNALEEKPLTGWTGYTWNEKFFPNYKRFLNELKKRNLHTALNLHPADGVAAHEQQYEEMAKSVGIDPKTKRRVKFDVLNKEFMKSYFDILHHPYEDDGVDFWWMDWQQGKSYAWLHEPNIGGNLKNPLEFISPLWMLNHYHIVDIMRNRKRPMFFSRFCGAGSARYSIGFSGDAIITWESLKFQPYFTATASNIGYSFWSHDIGGHMLGYRNDELYIRWLQLGVLSPINRLHSCNEEFIHKEPWCYSAETERIAKRWLRLRHELFPYIYTACYNNHSNLVPMIQPMYYSYPETGAAYECKTQYMFGSELMISPIVEANDNLDKLGKAEVWFPKGDWYDFFTGDHYYSKRNRKLNVYRPLDVSPVFAKAGAIIPMAADCEDNELKPRDTVTVHVFPNADNTYTMYEDSGEYLDFENGEFAKTEFLLKWQAEPTFTIKAACGKTELLPKNRTWIVKLRAFDESVIPAAFINGSSAEIEKYIDEEGTVCVKITASIDHDITIKLNGEKLTKENESNREAFIKILDIAQVSFKRKNELLSVLDVADSNWQCSWNFYNSSENEFHLVGALKEKFLRESEEYPEDLLKGI